MLKLAEYPGAASRVQLLPLQLWLLDEELEELEELEEEEEEGRDTATI